MLHKALPLLFILAQASAFADPKPQTWNEEVGYEVNSLANRIDSYFGQKRADDEKSGSTLRLSPQLGISEFSAPKPALDMRLNLHLSTVEKWGRDATDYIFKDNSSDSNDGEENEPIGDELSHYSPKVEGWTQSVETHAAGLAPPVYGLLLRVRKNYDWHKWINRVWFSTGWQSDSLWENNANLTSDYAVSKTLLFRFFNQWTYNMSSSLQTTAQGPSWYHTYSDKLSFSYDFRVNMAIESGAWLLDNYSATMTIRRMLKRNWIFLEIDPSVDFGRSYGFQRQLSLFAKVEFVFGNF